MTSQYLCSSAHKREVAQAALHAHGYIEAFRGDSGHGKTLVVHHPDAYVYRVDDLVRKADPSAQRICLPFGAETTSRAARDTTQASR